MKSLQRVALYMGTVIVLLSAYSVARAQGAVQFEALTFEQAVTKARNLNKMVFVDVRGMNTSPLNQQVEKEVFTLDSVVRFFNDHCISIQVNMNSEEGKKFAPRLAMLMYPVYVFHDSNGDQLEFVSPGSVAKAPQLLMNKANASLAIAKIKMNNKRSIVFVKDKWSNLLARAKKENKMIFLDAFTEWCRPCIQMARDVFTLDTVADYYNSNFINVGMDMEKEEGPLLAKKYKIKAYPSFLYIDGDGNLVSQDGGYQEADKFIKAGETAVVKFGATRPAASAFVRPVRLMAPGTSKASAVQQETQEAKPSAINFSSKSWNDMLKEAKDSGKLIFMDAFTTWCGPCKSMRANVFTKAQVGRLFNRNFLNAYIDMEKGEGLELRKRYEVRAYPTYLFVNGEGEVVHKVVGSCPEEEFMQHALDALSATRNLKYFTAAYAKKAGDPGFIAGYLEVLSNAYEQKQTNEVALTYLNTLKPAQWEQKENWAIIHDHVKDAGSPVFNYLVSNQSRFEELYGKQKVSSKIYLTYMAWPITYLSFPKEGKPVLDEGGYKAFLEQLSASSYEKKGDVMARSMITVYGAQHDWDNYTSTVQSMLQDKLIAMDAKGAEDLYTFAYRVYSAGQEHKKAMQAAAGWAKTASQDIPAVAAIDKITYLELYANLLEKTGERKLAKTVREKMSSEELKKAKDGAAFQPLIRMVPK